MGTATEAVFPSLPREPMIRFGCPCCGTITFFKDSKAGQQTWCPACHHEIRVRAADMARPEPRLAQKPAAKKKARPAWTVALVGAPVLGLMAWGVVLLNQPRETNPPQQVARAQPARGEGNGLNRRGVFTRGGGGRINRMFGPPVTLPAGGAGTGS